MTNKFVSKDNLDKFYKKIKSLFQSKLDSKLSFVKTDDIVFTITSTNSNAPTNVYLPTIDNNTITHVHIQLAVPSTNSSQSGGGDFCICWRSY